MSLVLTGVSSKRGVFPNPPDHQFFALVGGSAAFFHHKIRGTPSSVLPCNIFFSFFCTFALGWPGVESACRRLSPLRVPSDCASCRSPPFVGLLALLPTS